MVSRFLEFVIDGGGEANWRESGLGEFFETDEILGAEKLFEFVAAEIGNGENFLNPEAGVAEDFFHVFRMVIVKAVGIQVFEMGDFLAEGVNVGFFEPIAENLGQGALVGNFDDGGAAGLENAVKLVGDFLHVFEMVGGAYHEEGVESIVFEGDVVDVARFGGDFVAVKVFSLGELGLGIVKNGGDFGAGDVFVGEAPVAAGNVDELVAVSGEEFANS